MFCAAWTPPTTTIALLYSRTVVKQQSASAAHKPPRDLHHRARDLPRREKHPWAFCWAVEPHAQLLNCVEYPRVITSA